MNMRVICVDDEAPVLENFKRKTKDFQEIDSITLFQSAKKALEWVEQNPIDVAFLDMEMPQMSGIELAKKLKQIDRNIRIIFVIHDSDYILKTWV